jgi:hypothetical protein
MRTVHARIKKERPGVFVATAWLEPSAKDLKSAALPEHPCSWQFTASDETKIRARISRDITQDLRPKKFTLKIERA